MPENLAYHKAWRLSSPNTQYCISALSAHHQCTISTLSAHQYVISAISARYQYAISTVTVNIRAFGRVDGVILLTCTVILLTCTAMKQDEFRPAFVRFVCLSVSRGGLFWLRPWFFGCRRRGTARSDELLSYTDENSFDLDIVGSVLLGS
jgi:hypothetical protein